MFMKQNPDRKKKKTLLKTFLRVNHTMLTLSESYYHTILTERDLISNGIHNFTDLLPLLPNNSKHFFESFK